MIEEPPELQQPSGRDLDFADMLEPHGRRERDARGIAAALLLTIFLHLALVWVVPWEVIPVVPVDRPLQREIEYVYVEEEPESEEMEFVETNPDIPTNPPDETQRFSNRDQQASQIEESDEGPTDAPLVTGDEEESNRIINEPFVPDTVPPTPPPQPEAVPQPEQTKAAPFVPPPQPVAPDFIEQEVETEEGLASMLDQPDENAEPVEQPDESESAPLSVEMIMRQQKPEEGDSQETTQPQPAQQPQQPLPRPRLATRAIPGPIMRSVGRAPVLGQIGVSAQFTEFGDYLARMFDAIGRQFQILANNSEATRMEVNTRVIVDFEITPTGDVVDVRVIHTTAARVPTMIGVDSIQSPAPFDEWTQEMIDTLNEREQIRITFIYR